MCVLTGTERRRDNTSQHRDLYVSEWEDVDEVRQPQELFRIPGTVPGGYLEYPDPLRGGLLKTMLHISMTVTATVKKHRCGEMIVCLYIPGTAAQPLRRSNTQACCNKSTLEEVR